MSSTLIRIVAACAIVLLSSCATAPKGRYSEMDAGNTLSVVAKQRHRLIEQFVERDSIENFDRFGVPRVEIGEGAIGPGISESQAALVANNAGRALCSRLGKYFALDDSSGADTPDVRLVLSSIVPTGRVAAGASSILGIFVPVPFRLPTGLGALAGEAEVRGPDNAQLAAMRWARGANSVTNSAKLSTIGDAWQLAKQFGDQFARAIVDTNPKRAGIQREPVQASVRVANREICDRRFGTVNLAGRGASLVLPLSPESIDAGAPNRNERSTEP